MQCANIVRLHLTTLAPSRRGLKPTMAAAAARLRPAACAAVVSILIVALATSVAASSSSSSSADGLPENADSEHVHGRVAAAAASLLVGAVLVVALVGGACCSRRPVPMEEQIAQPMNVAKRKPFVYVKVGTPFAHRARTRTRSIEPRFAASCGRGAPPPSPSSPLPLFPASRGGSRRRRRGWGPRHSRHSVELAVPFPKRAYATPPVRWPD